MLDFAESKIARHTERKTSPSPDHVSFLVVVCRVAERVSPGAMWQHLPAIKTWSKVTCVPVGNFCYFRRFPPELCIIRCYSPPHLPPDPQTASQLYVAGIAKGFPLRAVVRCHCVCVFVLNYACISQIEFTRPGDSIISGHELNTYDTVKLPKFQNFKPQ